MLQCRWDEIQDIGPSDTIRGRKREILQSVQ
jgi:hypothetical protein